MMFDEEIRHLALPPLFSSLCSFAT